MEHCDLGDSVLGLYYSPTEGVTDGKVVFIHDSILEKADFSDADSTTSWKAEFYETYLHETLHYLGSSFEFTMDAYEYIFLIEGITEALTQRALTFGGYTYDPDYTGYSYITRLAHQLLTVDKDIVLLLIDGTGYRVAGDLDTYFTGKSFDGMLNAINRTMTLLNGHPNTRKYHRMAQYYMGEYLKYYDLTEAQMMEIANNLIAPIKKLG